jgi:hypothetical protein
MKEGPLNGRMHFSAQRTPKKKKKPWIAFRTWETRLKQVKAEKVKNGKWAPAELNLRTESSL